MAVAAQPVAVLSDGSVWGGCVFEVEESFSAFVARAWPGLVRTAALLTGDQAAAEDLAQSALVRTYRRWWYVRRQERPDLYVRRVMVNLRRDWWRRDQGRLRLVAELPDRALVDTGGLSQVSERDATLTRALAELPPRMRATLVLRFFEDLSEYQVAGMLGCSVGTVKSQTSRGLARLRDALEASSAGPEAPEPRPGGTDTSTDTDTDTVAGNSTLGRSR